jgi:hypothetical protein
MRQGRAPGRARTPRRLLCAGLALPLCSYIAADHCFAAEPSCAGGAEARARVASISDRLDITLADGRQARLGELDLPDPGRGDPVIGWSAASLESMCFPQSPTAGIALSSSFTRLPPPAAR